MNFEIEADGFTVTALDCVAGRFTAEADTVELSTYKHTDTLIMKDHWWTPFINKDHHLSWR